MRVIEGKLDGTGLKLGLVVSRFNEAIVSRLESGALDCLLRHGVASDDLTVVRVPGAWEIPVAAARLVAAGGYDAVICLGVLIRGGTAHFELIAAEVAKGVAQVAMASAIPVSFGVVTAESIEQALERAGTKLGNKGWEAALAAIEMARVTAELPPAPRPRGR